jgi:hypothetical protein
MDERLGFSNGYPLILLFFRGFFCPRDQEQMRQLVRFQEELAVTTRTSGSGHRTPYRTPWKGGGLRRAKARFCQ